MRVILESREAGTHGGEQWSRTREVGLGGVSAPVDARAAGVGDLDALVALSLACTRSHRSWSGGDWQPPAVAAERRLWWERLRDPDTWVCVALSGITHVGCACVWPAPSEAGRSPGLAYMAGPLVDPDWWGEGIGGALLGEAVAALEKLGFARAEIAVEAGNAHARRFLEHHGWELADPGPRRSPMTVVVYGRTLSGGRARAAA